ncbi:MAG: EamA family transporter [Rudaea sp.]
MSTLIITFWMLNLLLDTGGHLAFKTAAALPDCGDGMARWRNMAQRPWIWVGVACFVAEFVVWLAFLSLVPLSRGVLLGSINIVAVMLAGRWVFAEKFTPLRIAGGLLIALGVAIVGVS